MISMGSRRQEAVDDGEQSLIGPPSATDGDVLDRDASTPGFVYVLAFFSALGGFLFGYDTGVVSGAMLLLKEEMNLSALWQELLVSSTVGAAALSALSGGFLNGWFGRRVCILLASFIFSIGGFILSVAPGKVVLLVGRITVGLGIGIASMTVPVYIAEVSPPHKRGQLVTINSLFITGGQFVASVIDGAFSYMSHDGWRYMLGLSVVPAVLQFVGFLFLPESPRWLLQKGRSQEARQALSRMRGGRSVDEEYDSIRTSIEEEEKEEGAGGVVIWRILSNGPTRRALIVGCGLQMFQQLSGINTVMYYSATILQMAGVRDVKQAIWLAAATSATNFVFTLVGVWLVERVGRRKLTLGSLIGTGLSLTVLAVGFLLSAQYSPPTTLHPVDPQNSTCRLYGFCEFCMLDPNCGFCYRENNSRVFDSSCVPVDQASTDQAAWGSCSNQTEASKSPIWAYNYCPTSYSWVVLLGLILYLASFAPGMGTMPWTVNSEIYPLWARSTGNACSAGVNWIFNVLVSLTFLHVAQYLTYYGAFFMYTGLVVLGLFFVQGCLPETKGLQLEDVEDLFTGPLCSCGASSATHSGQVQYTRVNGSNRLTSDNDDSDVE
ncbi:proton myo-inositol cotransporter-like [Anoplopoma fimbria]|uniref:proton myo-inositol cotransporter-like n=1 Tax=Anoplopoma fimbria TaxID=229290 RepID=UPI0023ED3D0D|nr:proton myo-inositol cotransporter-like [Anoplopoma fimbria]XP_054476546.1 proton myo-inositol cotransporter-like [Anoplopoma fimbria]XP_054476547.1 proton myo-inositol cotransporter-like [Anoplopoma fimbria]XP_054476548.1 proton myo-inositol cotransporter-like [Anoplopoma fimbria]XP_054476549.1 proton myo-inositol cotransporter-like [Anoplopoma fimbria]XP_054476550.1 proton myo-inositol cotransporter-like [Anoplopoma fimbria]